MSHKEKTNPFTKIFGAGTIALLGLVAVTTFAPMNSNLSATSLLDSLASISTKAGSTVNLGAAQGVLSGSTKTSTTTLLTRTQVSASSPTASSTEIATTSSKTAQQVETVKSTTPTKTP